MNGWNKKGWISRVASERDRRARALSLTPKGQRTDAALVPSVQQPQEEILQALGVDDRAASLQVGAEGGAGVRYASIAG